MKNEHAGGDAVACPGADIRRPAAVEQTAPGRVMACLRRDWVAGVLLIAMTVAAYLPVWHAGYIWDDDVMLTGNKHVQSADGLRAIWCSTELPDYFPLTSTALWLQWRLWGPDPTGYHVVNVLLHALAAAVWWRVFRRLAVPGAWLAAALFALHPVNVESVAWITELKNTLSMLCCALAVLAWLRAERVAAARVQGDGSGEQAAESSTLADGTAQERDALSAGAEAVAGAPASRVRFAWYLWSVAVFGLALLAKTAVAPLPVMLVALAWWRRGRLEWRDVWRSVPFFALSAILAVVTMWFHAHRAVGGMMVREDGFGARLAGAGWAVWFYLYKLLAPLNLIFVYPRWQIDGTNPLSYVPVVGVAAGLWVCWRFRHAWGRGWLFGMGWFVAMLLPVLGFIDISYMRHSFVADRWQYFAMLGPVALVATGITAAIRGFAGGGAGFGDVPCAAWRPTGRRGVVAWGACAVLLAVLGGLAYRQARIYVDVETLWRTTLARNPTSAVAATEIGSGLMDKGQLDDALAYYEKALGFQPNYGLAHHNYGCVLLMRNRPEEAVVRFRLAVKYHPALQPAHLYLGRTLLQLGKIDEAVVELKAALALQPDLAETHYHLGSARLQQGRIEEAIAYFQKAIALDPVSSQSTNDLGVAFIQLGRVDEALAQFERALALEPNSAEAHNNVGKVLLQKGRIEDAVARYRAALKLQPDNPDTLSNLAWVLATSADARIRSGMQAIVYAQRAIQHAGRGDPLLLRTLAAAYAEAGRFSEATTTAQRALELAAQTANPELVQWLQADIRLYANGTSLRDGGQPSPER